VPRGFKPARRGDQIQIRKITKAGGDTHLSKSTFSYDPMEIKVIQADFAFKIYRSGKTRAHISSAAWRWVRVGRGEAAVRERKGIRSVKSVVNVSMI